MLTVPTFALVFPLVAWINSTGLIEPVWPSATLEVNVTNTLGFARDMQRCFEGEPAPPLEDLYEVASVMDGLYCLDRVTINGEVVDLATPHGQTVLVHELVHWLQDHGDQWDDVPCRAALEWDAYRVDRLWQREMGLAPKPSLAEAMAYSMCPDTAP